MNILAFLSHFVTVSVSFLSVLSFLGTVIDYFGTILVSKISDNAQL